MKGATDFTFKGVSWSGGGRAIERVDVSIDGGDSWTASELYKPVKQKCNHNWAWTQFSKTIALPEDIKEKLRRGEKVEMDITSKVFLLIWMHVCIASVLILSTSNSICVHDHNDPFITGT